MIEPLNAILAQSEGVNLVLIMEPVIATVMPEMPLSVAFEKTKKLDVEHLPVVSSSRAEGFIGVLNCRAVRRSLSAEVLARQQKADEACV